MTGQDHGDDRKKDFVCFLQRLVDLLRPAPDGIEFKEQDHFALMCLCFLSRQTRHAEAVIRLKDHPDAELITRSMVEGLVQFLWTAGDPGPRARRWREYAAVYDWKLFHQKRENGEEVPEKEAEEIRARMELHGDQFLTARGRQADASERPLGPTCYHDNWYGGGKLRDLFGDVQAQRLYDIPYGAFSAWHHWDISSLAARFEWSNDPLLFTFSLEGPSVGTVPVAFQCLLRTGQVADSHLSLGIGEELSELKAEYLERFDGSGTRDIP